MIRNLRRLLLLAFAIPAATWPCDCGPPKPACAYWSADAIFLGRVSFENDDNSGRFAQRTLVRFDVEERFKGVAPQVDQVWVDPGSFTSCYENYRLGARYLIVATRSRMPGDTASMGILRDSAGQTKPFPPGFDPRKPPAVYYAPVCGGSRPADPFPHLDQDLAMLRTLRSGATLPRVFGRVYLSPFRGWPQLNGPALKGARVTIRSETTTLAATTDDSGSFSLAEAPAGDYTLAAELPPLHATPSRILHVPDVGCGYGEVKFKTATGIQGTIFDHQGKPTPRIPVVVRLKDKKLDDAIDSYALMTDTDATGRFAITGLPDADFYLSAGNHHPSTGEPHGRVYFPRGRSREKAAVLRLKPGELRLGMDLVLDPPLEIGSVKVHVVDKNSRPAEKAFVQAFQDGVIEESATTDASGFADVPCLLGLQYELRGQEQSSFPVPVQILRSPKKACTCSDSSAVVELVLDHMARFWEP